MFVPYWIKCDSLQNGVFLFQQPAVLSSCLDTSTFLNLQRQKQKNTTHLPLLSVLSHIFDICFPSFHPHSPHLPPRSFRGGWVPKSQKSGCCSTTSTSVIMGCLALQGRASRNVCVCHIWYSTPAQSVFLCLPGRIILKYSGGCRNALINTVALQLPFLCVYEAEPSRFGPLTDLTMCWCGWGPRQFGKLLDNLGFFFLFFFLIKFVYSPEF